MSGKTFEDQPNFDDSRRSKLFYEVSDDITQQSEFLEFIRKLGLAENRLQEKCGGGKIDKYDLLNCWYNSAGFPSNQVLESLLPKVREEIFSGISGNVDKQIKGLGKPEITEARQVAWFCYAFVQQHINGNWDRIVREKLNLDPSRVAYINTDNAHSAAEQQFGTMLLWKRKEKINTVQDMIDKLNKIGLALPPSKTYTYIPAVPSPSRTSLESDGSRREYTEAMKVTDDVDQMTGVPPSDDNEQSKPQQQNSDDLTEDQEDGKQCSDNHMLKADSNNDVKELKPGTNEGAVRAEFQNDVTKAKERYPSESAVSPMVPAIYK